MKIKRGFIMRKVGDEHIALAVDSKKTNFNGMIKLNASAALLWEFFQKEHTLQDAISFLMDRYEIDEETARTSAEAFIATLKENGFAE